MPDTSADGPIRIFAGEPACVGAWLQMGCSIVIALKGYCWHSDNRAFGKPLLQVVVLRFTLRKPLPPTIIMNDNGDMVGIIERGSRAVEGGIIEIPSVC
jgi:hypothetical protein